MKKLLFILAILVIMLLQSCDRHEQDFVIPEENTTDSIHSPLHNPDYIGWSTPDGHVIMR